MKILYLHQYFATRDQPWITRSYEMARRFVAHGHQVTVVTSSSVLGEEWAPLPGWNRREVDGIQVEVVGVEYSNKQSFSRRIRAFGEFMVRATLHAPWVDCDVVFATSTPLTVAIPGLMSARLRRVPMVFEVRDLWPEMPIAVGALKNPMLIAAARKLERAAYLNSNYVIALSPGMRDGVVKAGFPSARVEIVPNSCDVDLFDVSPELGVEFRKSLPWLGAHPLVVYAGTFGALNRVSYLAEVAAEMVRIDPAVRFVVVGDGSEQGIVRERARTLGVLDRNFFMLPPLPKLRMPALLSAATITTSLFGPIQEMWVNSANKFFDGLAAGRPVAINYGGWQAEVLGRSGAGIRLDEASYADAARQLADFIGSPSRLAKARKAARELAIQEFGRDQLADRLEGVLQRAVDEGPLEQSLLRSRFKVATKARSKGRSEQ